MVCCARVAAETKIMLHEVRVLPSLQALIYLIPASNQYSSTVTGKGWGASPPVLKPRDLYTLPRKHNIYSYWVQVHK